jgi:phage tail tape-measure protein
MKWKNSKAGGQRIAHEAEGAAAGALAGAALGSAAGPPGIAAGAVIGGVAGVISGAVLDSESSRQISRSRELDAQIGVSEGDLGAPNLKHPPAKRGAYSAASAGVDSASGEEPAEGPMQVPER